MKRLFGFALVPHAEIVDGLRANVSKLQLKVNTQQKYISRIETKNSKLRRQAAIDRQYIEGIKTAGWDLVNHLDEQKRVTKAMQAGASVLRDALEGKVTLDDGSEAYLVRAE